MRLVVEAMLGLGDNVYSRVAVRHLARDHEVYVRTPWPQLYHDLPVRCLRPETTLRTQRRNVDASAHLFAEYPYGVERRHLYYDHRASIPSSLAQSLNLPVSGDFSLSVPDAWRVSGRPAVVVPPTVRTEWRNVARPCDPAYLQQLIDAHPGFDWVELSDLSPPHETLFGRPLRGTRPAGPLTTEALLGLLASAGVIVTSPGYALPLGLALRTPTLCLFGGDIPERLLVERWMIGAPYAAVSPSPFCDCGLRSRHEDPAACNRALDPVAVDRAFRSVALQWDGDHGYWPVHVNGQYNQAYFDKYVAYEQTLLGHELNAFRIAFTNRHFPNAQLVDVGPGSCQFVKATNALGFDINPATVAELKRLGRWANPDLLAGAEVLTFWDSLEHIPDPASVLRWARKGAIVSMPIYEGREHVLQSRHFRPDEHFHYWTHEGFIRYMASLGFAFLEASTMETALGRDGVETFAFRREGSHAVG